MWDILAILFFSAILFYKERSLGTLVFVLYFINLTVELLFCLLRWGTMAYIMAVFGSVFLRKHPTAPKAFKTSLLKAKIFVIRNAPQTEKLFSLPFWQTVHDNSTLLLPYLLPWMDALKISDVSDLVYNRLYSDSATMKKFKKMSEKEISAEYTQGNESSNEW